MNAPLIPNFKFNKKMSLEISEAQGSWLSDTKGHKYIDHCLGSGALILGHGAEEVTGALISQLKKGVSFGTNWNEKSLELSNYICAKHNEFEKIAFLSTGSEAVSFALRAARAFTGKNQVIRFCGAYHGHHDFNFSEYVGSKDSAGIPDSVKNLTLNAEFNDLESIEKLLVENKDVAAVVCEPIQRFLVPNGNFLEKVQSLCRSHGVLFILDEIVTAWRFADECLYKQLGLSPDLVCLGKIIGGGLPLSAVAGRADVLNLGDSSLNEDKQQKFIFNGTCFGNPLSSVSSLSTLKTLSAKDNLDYSELNRIGDDFRHKVNKIISHLELSAQVCGYGSMWRVVFSKDTISSHQDYLRSNIEMEEKFDYALLSQGIYTIPLTRKYLSFAHSKNDLELSLKKIELALRSL